MIDPTGDNEFIRHDPCEECGSSDAKGVFSDGHTYCFSCNNRGDVLRSDGRENTVTHLNAYTPTGEFTALRKRRISKAVCRKFDYRVDPDFAGGTAQLAVYHHPQTGHPVAAKVRQDGKKFRWEGNPKEAGLFGQHLFSPSRRLVITEGEVDALSVAEANGGGKWPVVSLPNGAAAARRDCAKQIEWLEQWKEVVLMFDQDEPGIKAANEVVELLSPGKATVASLPLKDANEVLCSENPGDIVRAIFSAREVRPDGIVSAADLWEEVQAVEVQSEYSYPWQFLNEVLYGLRPSEIVTVVSGSGMGKSAFVKEIAHHLLMAGKCVGGVFLEETVKRSVLGMMGIHVDRPLHLPNGREGMDDTQLRQAFDSTAGTGRLFFFDHFGSTDPERLYNKLRYLVKGCGCDVLCLDHISILVSGISEGDERRLIDNVITDLRTLAQELNVVFILVSHLRRPAGLGHEEGAQTSLSQLRGSAAIAQLSDQVIGLERDQQDDKNKHISTVRVLKNRFSGETGVAGYLEFSPTTGRLTEVASSGKEFPSGVDDAF